MLYVEVAVECLSYARGFRCPEVDFMEYPEAHSMLTSIVCASHQQSNKNLPPELQGLTCERLLLIKQALKRADAGMCRRLPAV
jgi:hypothetical protein